MKKKRMKARLLAWVAMGISCSLGAQNLPDAVRSALEKARLPASALHVVVAPAQGGKARLSHGADTPVNPASLMKLVTTSVALDTLGPAYTWRTSVWVDGPIIDNELRGNLYIQGSGDPKLVVERLWLLMRRIQALGIRRIAGDIILDQSAFDPPATDPAAFDGEPTKPYNATPEALLINFKSVLLHWVPDPESKVARLHAEPPLSGLSLPTEVPLQSGPCNDVRSSLKADFSDPNEWKFRGAYPAECGERIWPVAYTDPASYAIRAIQGMWKTTGGQLSGQVRTGTVIAQARPIVYAQSPPLAEIVRDINKYSNNLMAEQLFLTMGMQEGGVGQMQIARQRVQKWWDQHVGVPGLGVDNGSGLSRTARVSAQGLAQLLQHVWASPYMPELMASLPIQGMDGTLRRVQSETRAHLKTGSGQDVLGVAGYVDGPRGQRWVLVAIIEHPGAPNGRAVLQSLAEWTASQQAHQP